MSVRRCATQGCPGTLPAGVGSHCPRCGGTEFIPSPGRGRWFIVILVVLLAAATAFVFLASHHSVKETQEAKEATAAGDGPSADPSNSKERQALMEARDVAARMSDKSIRDAAYSDILHRALAEHDFDFACTIGNDISPSYAFRDSCLNEIVQGALNAHRSDYAKRAAEEMGDSFARDSALQMVLNANSPK